MELHDYDAATSTAVRVRDGLIVGSHVGFRALLLLLMMGRWSVPDVWKREGGK